MNPPDLRSDADGLWKKEVSDDDAVKNYTGKVEFDDETDIFYDEIIGPRSSRSALLLERNNGNQFRVARKIICVVGKQKGDVVSEHGGHNIGVMNLLAGGRNL